MLARAPCSSRSPRFCPWANYQGIKSGFGHFFVLLQQISPPPVQTGGGGFVLVYKWLEGVRRTRTRIVSREKRIFFQLGMLSAAPARGLHPSACCCIGRGRSSQPHPHADCIGNMQQSGLCIRTLCIQFIPYRVYPAEQRRSYRRTDLDFGV